MPFKVHGLLGAASLSTLGCVKPQYTGMRQASVPKMRQASVPKMRQASVLQERQASVLQERQASVRHASTRQSVMVLRGLARHHHDLPESG